MKTSTTPCRDAYLAADAAAVLAQTAYDNCDCEEGPDGLVHCEHYDASATADQVRDDAREALRLSDEPREYTIGDGNGGDETIVTDDPEGEARDWTDGGDWGSESKTSWVRVYYRSTETGEKGSVKVEIEPTEPKCERGHEHEWSDDKTFVGGIKSNPGVFGSGGGVRIHTACIRCGCGKIVDTWTQDRTDGEQGLTSVEYREGEYSEAIAAIAQAVAS